MGVVCKNMMWALVIMVQFSLQEWTKVDKSCGIDLLILAICLVNTMAGPTENRAVQAVTEANNQFSTSFFAEVASSNHGNLVTSPLSASVVLSMAAYGARGETQDEMRSVLHLLPESQAKSGYSSLLTTLNQVTDVELRLANKVFVNNKFSVKPTFQQLTQNAFLSTSKSVDFSQSASAANTINQWVEEQTNHRIKDLVKSESLNGGTAMVLVNAVYFKGNWKKKFDPKLTQDRPFHVSKTEVKNVPTMYRSGKYNYGVLPECKASFIELPYKGEEFSMVIILPDEVDGLAAIEKKLAVHGLGEVLKRGHITDVDVYLPKFKIESSIKLNEHLKNMGIRKAFSIAEANFSGISDTDLYISEVVQKAFIEVNEEGSEAAGATVTLAYRCLSIPRPPPPPIFKVDRPFHVKIIRMKNFANDNPSSTKLELFTAHVVDPSDDV
ncbi:PREDICTED: serine protease inhibitor 3/4-like isoform X5 [Polistes canadensis]|uniref:serine protease inhibitor 3/4-like isoform X5 n=1 Tax=Polistes canadensis TaxID=91411 RepID=UPI000718E878|nr:PREDICTED: serine protease inhibitor 3/4-like isoform X5 [Polistes canadensis]